jgi:hypothetical protein
MNANASTIMTLIEEFNTLVNSLNTEEQYIKNIITFSDIITIKNALNRAINNNSKSNVVNNTLIKILKKIESFETLFSDTNCNNIRKLLCVPISNEPIIQKIYYGFTPEKKIELSNKCPLSCDNYEIKKTSGGSKRTYKKTEKTVKIGKLTRCVHLYGKTEYVKMNGDMKTVKSAQKASKSKSKK